MHIGLFVSIEAVIRDCIVRGPWLVLEAGQTRSHEVRHLLVLNNLSSTHCETDI